MFTLKKGYNDCSNEEYHSDRSFYSSSALKMLLKDKQAFYRKFILNEKQEKVVNHNFTFGSLIHAMLLEPELVDDEFCVFDGNKSSQAYKTFVKENKGKEIVTPTAWNNALHLRDVCRQDSAFSYIQGGEAEKTLAGEMGGMPIKVRADYIKDDYILDIKTTSMDITKIENIERACANYGYALSAALYLDMFKKKRKKLKRFLFWFVHKQTGNTALVQASEEFLEHGRNQIKEAIDIYNEAVKNDNWEGLPLIFPKY